MTIFTVELYTVAPNVGGVNLSNIATCNELHELNALAPILVTEFGMLILGSDLQDENAVAPILVIELGILISDNA